MSGNACKAIKTLREKLDWLPPLLTRITMGTIFIQSGWGKWHNLPKVVDFFTSLGIPAPQLQAPMVASVELVGGILVFFGIFTRIASVPLMATMVVAIATALWPDVAGVSDFLGLEEFAYFLLLLWLAFRGAGCVSVDHLICCRKRDDRTEPARP